jgi:crotonobetainyl-CoA:carnitine CoA-transferase CaiB-like acyl-CoA transferase
MTKPLAGIRIADFTVHNAGPFCTNLLSQLGAEVIKIESAMRLDAFRKPHPVYGRMGPATFDQVASTKLSVRLNLKKPDGIALAKKLVAISDIAAESFRPGVVGRLGLGYETLKGVKPDIIMLSISSSGQTGPDAHFAGYAPLFGAWGGLSALTGYADGPPVEMRHVMDHTVGMNAAVAVMAALHKRQATGLGSFIDVSARDVASSLAGESLLWAAAGGTPGRTGNDHPRMAPHGVYRCAGDDRWMSVAVSTEAQRQALSGITGRADLASWAATRPAEDCVAALQAAGIAAHVSWDTRDLTADHHLRVRGAHVDVQERDGAWRAAVKVPMRLSKGNDIGMHSGTPTLGEHEDYVYGDKPRITSTALARNGTRHPHAGKSASGSRKPSSMNRALAARKPIGAPNCMMETKRDSQPGGAFSTASRAAPPHSPPSPRPWPNRIRHSRAGAIHAAPRCSIVPYVGRKAMASVEHPISSSEATRVDFRPARSPKWPNRMAPIGRAMKATPKLMKASNVWAGLDCAGKNSGPKTSAAAIA